METAQALSDAVGRGDSAALARLLAEGADPAAFDDGEPVALAAADTGKVELVRPFLDAGLPVDWECLGITPLMCAVSAGSLPLVEFLIDRGADVDGSHDGPEPATVMTWALETVDPRRSDRAESLVVRGVPAELPSDPAQRPARPR